MHRSSRMLAKGGRQFSSIVMESFGQPASALKLGGDVSPASPVGSEVVVAMKAAGVSNADYWKIHGMSVHSRRGTAGHTGVGVVTATGPTAQGVKANDTVFLHSGSGTWANAATACATRVQVVKSPPAVAAQLPNALTAYALLHHSGVALKAGDTVVVDSTVTPMGKLIAQLGKQAGVAVTQHVPAAKGESSNVQPKSKLVLCGGSGKARSMLKDVAPGGTLVLYQDEHEGGAAAQSVAVPYAASIFGDVAVRGFDLQTWAADEANADSWRAAVVAVDGLVASEALTLPAAKSFPAANWQEALAAVGKDGEAVITL